MAKRVGVGFVGDGFIAHFHARSWVSVRDGDIVAVTSRREEKGQEFAAVCRELNVGDPAVYTDVREMVRQSDVDVVYILAPNYLRVSVVEAIIEEIKAGRSKVRAIALEKPLARNVQEAKRIIELIEGQGLLHGYLENQVFMPSVTRGKDLIWRRGVPRAHPTWPGLEEHSVPIVLVLEGPCRRRRLSDLMPSAEANRYLLTPPGERTSCGQWQLMPIANFMDSAQICGTPQEDYRWGSGLYQIPAEDYATKWSTKPRMETWWSAIILLELHWAGLRITLNS